MILKLDGPPGARWWLNITTFENDNFSGPILHALYSPASDSARLVQFQSGLSELFVVRVGDQLIEGPTVPQGNGWMMQRYGGALPDTGQLTLISVNIAHSVEYEYAADQDIDTVAIESADIFSIRGRDYPGVHFQTELVLLGTGLTYGSTEYLTTLPSVAWFPALENQDVHCKRPNGQSCNFLTTVDSGGTWQVSAEEEISTHSVEWYHFVAAEFPEVYWPGE